MENSKKKIPKSLQDCYATDAVSVNLWNWSEWLDVCGFRFLIGLIVIGIISTIAGIIAAKNAEVDGSLIFTTAVLEMIEWGLYAFITYCAYNVLSLLIASLASIVQHTRITANIALYNTAKEEGVSDEETKDSTHSAPKQNMGYSPFNSSNTKTKDGFWICQQCKTKNEESRLYCKDCGKYR